MSEPATILIVDDNQDLLDLLTEGLSDQFTIVTARNGIDGLTIFLERLPDCAVIDVKMPGLDGFQLVRILRGDPETADIPLIILTALPHEQGMFVGVASGADHYLTKPVLPSELIPAIYEAIAMSQNERAERMRKLAESDAQEGNAS